MQNFRTLGQQEKSNSIGEKRERREKTRQREERKMTEKNAANSGHYDLPATSKGCTRTFLGPIYNLLEFLSEGYFKQCLYLSIYLIFKYEQNNIF